MSDCSNASALHPPFVSQTKLNPLGRDSAVRERYRDEYWRTHDRIVEDRLLRRAQAFRHTVHLLLGQSILELGCGGGRFTRALLRVSRDENPITAVTGPTTVMSVTFDLAAELRTQRSVCATVANDTRPQT